MEYSQFNWYPRVNPNPKIFMDIYFGKLQRNGALKLTTQSAVSLILYMFDASNGDMIIGYCYIFKDKGEWKIVPETISSSSKASDVIPSDSDMGWFITQPGVLNFGKRFSIPIGFCLKFSIASTKGGVVTLSEMYNNPLTDEFTGGKFIITN